MNSIHKKFSQVVNARPICLELRSSTALIVLSTSVAYFQDGFLYGSIVPVLPFSLRERSHVPETEIQFWNSTFLAIFGVFQVLGGPIAGWWADHSRSNRGPFLFGLLCAFGATASFMLATSMAVLVAARAMQGVSTAIINTLGLALLADTVDRDQLGFWMGLALSGMTLGILVGPPLAAIVYERVGYSWVFAMALIMITIDMMLRLVIIEKKTASEWLREESDADAQKNPNGAPPNGSVTETDGDEGCVSHTHETVSRVNGETGNGFTGNTVNWQSPNEATPLLDKPPPQPQYSFRRHLPASVILLTSPRIAAIVYGVLVNAILVSSFDATLPIFVSRTFHWNAEHAGLILLALTVMPLVGFIPGALADRYGRSNVVLVGFAVSTVSILLMGLIRAAEVGQIVMLAIFLFITSVGMSMFLSPLAAELSVSVEQFQEEEPELTGPAGATAQVYGLFGVAMGAGTVAGPILSGGLYQYAGWLVMCIALSLTCFSGSVPVILFLRRKKKTITNENVYDRE